MPRLPQHFVFWISSRHPWPFKQLQKTITFSTCSLVACQQALTWSQSDPQAAQSHTCIPKITTKVIPKRPPAGPKLTQSCIKWMNISFVSKQTKTTPKLAMPFSKNDFFSLWHDLAHFLFQDCYGSLSTSFSESPDTLNLFKKIKKTIRASTFSSFGPHRAHMPKVVPKRPKSGPKAAQSNPYYIPPILYTQGQSDSNCIKSCSCSLDASKPRVASAEITKWITDKLAAS